MIHLRRFFSQQHLNFRANQDIDESIAMLLGYAEDLTPLTRRKSLKGCMNGDLAKYSSGLCPKKVKFFY